MDKIIYFIDHHTWGQTPLCKKGVRVYPGILSIKAILAKPNLHPAVRPIPSAHEGTKYTDELWPAPQPPSAASCRILQDQMALNSHTAFASELPVSGKS